MAAGVCGLGRAAVVVRLSRDPGIAAQRAICCSRTPRQRCRGPARHGAWRATCAASRTRCCSRRYWNERMLESAVRRRALLASAFARYPYPGVVLRLAGPTLGHGHRLLPSRRSSARLELAGRRGSGRFPVTITIPSRRLAADLAARIFDRLACVAANSRCSRRASATRPIRSSPACSTTTPTTSISRPASVSSSNLAWVRQLLLSRADQPGRPRLSALAAG